MVLNGTLWCWFTVLDIFGLNPGLPSALVFIEISTVKPVYNSHSMEKQKVAVAGR